MDRLVLMGEPQGGLRSREAMTALVVAAGGVIADDLGVEAQTSRVKATLPDLAISRASRIMRVGVH